MGIGKSSRKRWSLKTQKTNSTMITVIIPMAGLGSRFVRKGYTLPKPFIDVGGTMMIERVLDGIKLVGADYVLVIQEKFVIEYENMLDLLKQRYPVKFVVVKQLTQGASCTALAAREYILPNKPVVFADSDNIFSNVAFSTFVNDAMERNLDGSLLTFTSSDPSFSYAEIDVEGRLIRTREKEVISNHAIAGAYFFRQGKYFINATIEMLIYGDRLKNEYYMSNVYNYSVTQGLNIGIFNISSKEWDCVGTPELLNDYLKKQKYNS